MLARSKNHSTPQPRSGRRRQPPTPSDRSGRSTAALGLMALSAVLFALMNFLARVATTSTSWANVGAVRAIVGALVAFAVARARHRSLAPQDWRAVFWRSLFGT